MLSAPLREFLRAAERLAAREPDVSCLLAWLTPEFRRLLATPDLLAPECLAAPTGGYVQHALYGSPSGRLALVALVWRPGACTPIHDHVAWGLAGVYRGCERETRYSWCEHAGAARLRVVDTREVGPGEVVPIVPPSDIHQVANPLPEPTVSLHLYGSNVLATASGTSVRCVYPPGLVLPAVPAGAR
ncbi:MAG TPA: cysteine dioxygenase family protein [Chloroflexota bacterium]|jgi:predicted metal-dependent enzyme (double-stranded beta helix superfamily)|nr:cysteine dioxygenase family protein [Chloroflexota bacterium]